MLRKRPDQEARQGRPEVLGAPAGAPVHYREASAAVESIEAGSFPSAQTFSQGGVANECERGESGPIDVAQHHGHAPARPRLQREGGLLGLHEGPLAEVLPKEYAAFRFDLHSRTGTV